MIQRKFISRAAALSIFLLSPIVGPRVVFAARGQISISADRQIIQVGDSFTLSVTIEIDGRSNYDSYTPPRMKGFRQASGGVTSQNIAMINWRVRRRETHEYQVIAERRGRLRIGPASIEIGGDTIRSNTIEIDVRDKLSAKDRATTNSGRTPHRFQTTPGRPNIRRDTKTVFLRASAEPQHVYVGQEVIAEWYLYTLSDISGFESLAQPSADGFWSETIASPRKLNFERKVVDGQVFYGALLARRALFAQRPGTLTIKPMKAKVSTLESFGRATVLASNPLIFRVKALPQAKPARTQADKTPEQNVGRFTIAATVDRDVLTLGDAFTFKISVRGKGNIRQLVLPTLPPIPGLKAYQPKISTTLDAPAPSALDNEIRGISGEKQVEHLLVAKEAGRLTIPALTLRYFDPETVRHIEIRSDALTITVRGSSAGNITVNGASPNDSNNLAAHAADTNGLRDRGHGPERQADLKRSKYILGPDIRPPIADPILFHRKHVLQRSVVRYLVLGIIPFFLLAIWAASVRLYRKRSGPSKRQQEIRVTRRVHKTVRTAESSARRNNLKEAYGGLANAIQTELSFRLASRSEGLTRSEIARRLKQRGCRSEPIAEIIQALEACDQGRFSDEQDSNRHLFDDAVARTKRALKSLRKESHRV